MARSRSHTRRSARANPRGVLSVHGGGYGFVQTSEGEFFVPASKMGGAFDGDVVELAALSQERRRGSGSGRAAGGPPAPSRQRPAARVVRVVERACDTLVGRYEVAEPFGVVVPEDPRIPYDIFTRRADRPDIEDGALVRVRIESYPTRHTAATGVVEEVVGRTDDAGAGVEVVIARHRLETAFSEDALAEARAAVLDEEGALAAGYRDLRGRLTFTIDPADARDFDDALSLDSVVLPNDGTADATNDLWMDESAPREELPCHPERSGEAAESKDLCGRRVWRLGVHIADVSHYVPWDCALDRDARRRGTSVYLVDRVVPMLPHELSGELCSLKPGETRRAMTVDLYLDDAGELAGYEVYPSLVRSDARLTYDEAQRLLEAASGPASASDGPAAGGAGAAGEGARAEGAHGGEGGGPAAAPAAAAPGAGAPGAGAGPIARRLAALSRLAKRRAAMRAAAGGLDFDTAEAKVRLDAEGRPVAIDLRRKTDATSLVEEAMILANETVARHLKERSFPSLYRVHESPDVGDLAALVPLLQEFPWFAEIDAARFAAGDPHALQRALAESAARPEGALVSTLLLRSMKRAVYRERAEAHYGLASEVYTHFTSPIRRYPDLVVHRMLKAQLSRRPEKFDQEVAALPWIAEHSSAQERVADAAARESQELKMVEYLQRDVGRAFPAVVSGVAAFGLHVRLENTAEGFLPVRALGREYFAFDPARHVLYGEDTGAAYRLGQRVAVVLVAADPRTRTLEFRLAAGKDEGAPRR